MVYLPAKGLKAMRTIHIIASQIWFGAVVCIFGFAFYCFNNTDAKVFLVLAPIIPRLYRMVVMPAALVCVAQGVVYGLFSKWGFVKFRWVLAKWVMLVLVVLCTGIGGIGQMFAILGKAQNLQTIRLSDGKLFFVFLGGQLILLCAMTIISVIKPGNKKAKVMTAE